MLSEARVPQTSRPVAFTALLFAFTAPLARALCGDVRTDQALDLPAGRAALYPPELVAAEDEDERGDGIHPERLHEPRVLVRVDDQNAETRLLRDTNPRDEARHAPRGTRARAREKEQRRPLVVVRPRSSPHDEGLPRTSGRKTRSETTSRFLIEVSHQRERSRPNP